MNASGIYYPSTTIYYAVIFEGLYFVDDNSEGFILCIQMTKFEDGNLTDSEVTEKSTKFTLNKNYCAYNYIDLICVRFIPCTLLKLHLPVTHYRKYEIHNLNV